MIPNMGQNDSNPVDQLGDLEFASAWFRFFGMRRGAELFAWILIARVRGVRSFRELELLNLEGEEQHGPKWSRSSLHRAWQDLSRFRTYLEARIGRDVPIDEVVDTARRYGRAREAT